MRRSIKAWSVMFNRTGELLVSDTVAARHLADELAQARRVFNLYVRAVPVTITYDDGRRSPRRRKSKAKGGERA